MLRYTFASHVMQAAVGILKVKEYQEHSNIRITRYAHLNTEIERESVKLLDSYSTECHPVSKAPEPSVKSGGGKGAEF